MALPYTSILAGASGQSSGYTIPYSARFVSGNSAYLTRTPGAASNQKTWTFSCWIKLGKVPADFINIFSAQDTGRAAGYQSGVLLYFANGAPQLMWYDNPVGTDNNCYASPFMRDYSAWYHCVVALDTTQATASDRVKLWLNGVAQTVTLGGLGAPTLNANYAVNGTGAHYFGYFSATTYTFDGYMANAYLIDGQALTASSFGQTNTSGVWVPKAYSGTYGTNGFFLDYGNSSYLGYDVKTSGVTTKFTNSSEWTGDTGDFSSLAQNIVPTGGNTGGIRTNDTFTGDFAVQFQWQGGANPAYLSVYDTVENATFNSATADAGVNSMTNAFQMFFGAGSVVDAKRGVTGTVSAGIFTAAANDWIKLQRSGSTFTCYQNGTLRYTWVATSSATMRIVVSQNSSSMDWRSFTWTAGSTTPANSFYVSGLVAGDQMTDTPTLNFATLNPLNKASSVTLSGGNLVYTTTAQRGAYGTIGVSSGKWYWEWKPGATGSETWVGIGTPNSPTNVALDSGTPSGVIVYGGFNGNLFTTGAGAAYGATFTTGDTVGVALDMDAGTLTFYKNNTTQGTAASSLTGTKVPVVSASNTHSGTINFGQTAFTYTPPTGFVALNTTNLPAPAIKDGSAHFQTALHTGTGSAITINQSGNSTFTSDFVWTKGRSGATDHILSDILQGTGKYWVTNTASAQETNAQALTAFGSGSISYGTMAAVNTNAATYVDWMWKANGAGVSNTSGSITSTVSSNTTAGISLVKWTTTGANGTVGHGLGSSVGMIIFEELSTPDSHLVWHRSLTAGGRRLFINSTAAQSFNADNFNSTDPTSTVFSVSIDNPNLGGTSLAICFAPIAGFSAFGSYTGNGSADGPFIYTGFRPAFVLPKRTDSTGVWPIQDTARSPYNVVDAAVFANQTSAETTGYAIDILSNGFKIRTTDTNLNASGGTYIYAAFASNPFGGSGAAPATAR